MKPAPTVTEAAWNLVAAYFEAHPELGLKESLGGATITYGGRGAATSDDNAGTLTMTDDAGRVVLRLDLTSWMGPSGRVSTRPD